MSVANLQHPTTLIDALHNMHPEAGGNCDYARGVLVGCMGSLVATGLRFDTALAVCSELAPRTILAHSVPPSWMEGFGLKEGFTHGWKDEKKFWLRTEGRT